MMYDAKTALVLGLGESGLAMALWLARSGALVRVADTREAPDTQYCLHLYSRLRFVELQP